VGPGTALIAFLPEHFALKRRLGISANEAVECVCRVCAGVGAARILLVAELPVWAFREAELEPAATMVGEGHEMAGDRGLNRAIAEVQPPFQLHVKGLSGIAEEIAKSMRL
jgi:hypothetical protein